MPRYSSVPGAKPRFQVLLTDEQLKDLKKLAADLEVDTSFLVNKAVVELIERDKKSK